MVWQTGTSDSHTVVSPTPKHGQNYKGTDSPWRCKLKSWVVTKIISRRNIGIIEQFELFPKISKSMGSSAVGFAKKVVGGMVVENSVWKR